MVHLMILSGLLNGCNIQSIHKLMDKRKIICLTFSIIRIIKFYFGRKGHTWTLIRMNHLLNISNFVTR